mgnify:FL=1
MSEDIVNLLVAVLLSLIMPGLGHVYCGRIVKGIILFFLSSIFIPVLSGKLSVSQSSVRITFIIVSLFASLVIWLVSIINSWYTARHTATAYELKDYNKWYVYVILMWIGTGTLNQIKLNIKSTLIDAYRVPTVSNYPTIVPNDRFLANKLAYKTSDPKKGDLVVFINPEDRRVDHVKRVVANAGDTVEIKDDELYINDQKLQRQKLPQSTLDNIRINNKGKPLEGEVFEEINGTTKYKIFLASSSYNKKSGDFAKITVPKYHCFVLGDNRNLSWDSRNFGPLPLGTIKGRVDYLYWPAKDWSRFGNF